MKTKPALPHTILWADDDADDRHVICNIVDTLADTYTIKAVENGSDVLHCLNAITDPAHFPRLVVLDINMPKLSGLQVLAQLKTNPRYQDLNIAVFTTSNSKADRLVCERYGVPMFTKPSTYEAFIEAVTELLQMYHITTS